MRVRFGKEEWLELEHLQLGSHVEEGRRVFEAGAERDARAAMLATSAVTQRFVAPELGGAFRARAEVELAAARVEPAVFRDPAGRVRVIYREVLVRFGPAVPESRRKAVLARHDLEIRRRNPFVPDQVIAVDRRRRMLAERTLELANALTELPEVVFAFPNFVSEFAREAVPAPIDAQWHLAMIGAPAAWAITQGKRVTVAVLDDGIDVAHPNLKRNIKRVRDPNELRDRRGRDFFVDPDLPDHFDPRPKRFRFPYDQMAGNDIHGTPCAGVVAGSGERGGVLGVAPQAKVLAVKLFQADDLAEEGRVANAIRYATAFADILSCSWSGPISPDIELALQEAGAGRGGLGCPVFCATGNRGEARVAYPARSHFAIAVGASTDGERRADYSSYGPEVAVVAPSSGGARAILTTDVSIPSRGFNLGSTAAGGEDGLHTNGFGGTSSAAPLAAGIAALVLAAHPGLSRDKVRDVLEATAARIGPANSYRNGRSEEYGAGRVDAAQAVARAVALATMGRTANRTALALGRRPRRH